MQFWRVTCPCPPLKRGVHNVRRPVQTCMQRTGKMFISPRLKLSILQDLNHPNDSMYAPWFAYTPWAFGASPSFATPTSLHCHPRWCRCTAWHCMTYTGKDAAGTVDGTSCCLQAPTHCSPALIPNESERGRAPQRQCCQMAPPSRWRSRCARSLFLSGLRCWVASFQVRSWAHQMGLLEPGSH